MITVTVYLSHSYDEVACESVNVHIDNPNANVRLTCEQHVRAHGLSDEFVIVGIQIWY